LGPHDEAVVPHVPHAKDQTEFLVAFVDNGVLAEDDGLCASVRSGQFGEDQTNHKGLDEATENGLSRHDDHSGKTVGGRLASTIATKQSNEKI